MDYKSINDSYHTVVIYVLSKSIVLPVWIYCKAISTEVNLFENSETLATETLFVPNISAFSHVIPYCNDVGCLVLGN